jgi:hypothetical protein
MGLIYLTSVAAREQVGLSKKAGQKSGGVTAAATIISE